MRFSHAGTTLIVGLLLTGCATHLNSRQTSSYRSDISTDEIRLELADIKHELKSTQVELNLLDERVRKETNTLSSAAKHTGSLATTQLETRIASLEKLFEKAMIDLRSLTTHTNQALAKLQSLEQEILSHEKRLDEVVKLKNTLTSISHAIGSVPSSLTSTTSYRVKAGDSLDKIARKYKMNVADLKALNNLKTDKIVVGQELKIADGTP